MNLSKRTTIFTVAIVLGVFISCNDRVQRRLNEELAITMLRKIRSAENAYRLDKMLDQYASLKQLVDAKLLDNRLADGEDSGYQFKIEIQSRGYKAIAIPVKYGVDGTGIESFYLDQSGVIRGADRKGGEAENNDGALTDKYQ